MRSEDSYPSARSNGGGTRWLVLFILGVVLLFNLSTWYLYNLTRDRLDTALGQRLQSIASVVAVTAEGSPAFQVEDPDLRSRLLDAFELSLSRIRDDNDLSNIFVVGPDDTTWIDLSGVVARGERNPFLDLDFSAVALARSGIPGYSRLYAAGGQYMKSGYAPIFDRVGSVAAIVGVEAGAGFFSALGNLRGILLGVSLGSGAGVLALGFIFLAIHRKLTRAQRALERAETLTAMGRMASSLAHEIRNPLAIIRGSAERLAGGSLPGEEHRDLCTSIAEEVDRLNRTLTGYLSFARGEAPAREEFDLIELLRRTLRLIEPELTRAGIALETNLEEERRVMVGDPHRMQQVFFNLLLNSQEALPEGGTISVREGRRGESIVVVFEDDGMGIPGDDLKHIFKPFFTRKSKGSGLGLPVVRRIVETHGGSVRVRSRPQKGTSFTLAFPAEPTASAST